MALGAGKYAAVLGPRTATAHRGGPVAVLQSPFTTLIFTLFLGKLADIESRTGGVRSPIGRSAFVVSGSPPPEVLL
jgi:hypothetical protein